MADNTTINTGSGGDTIRDLARQGGTVKTQVAQVDIGGATANAEVLWTAGQKTMSASAPVTIASDQTGLANLTTSGTLSASDAVVAAPIGDGTLVSGTSTAGSIVYSLVPDSYASWTLMIKNYSSGTIYTEASNNTTNGTDGDWVEVKGRRTGTAVGVESIQYAMVANGYYRGNVGGFKAIRARLIGGTGVTIQWVISKGLGATFLNSGMPAGNSLIGRVGGTNTLVSGTINAADTVVGGQSGSGDLRSGTPTTGSYVAAQLANGETSLILGLYSGTFSGSYYVERSQDSTNGINGMWLALPVRQQGYVLPQPEPAPANVLNAPGIYAANCAGAAWVRVRNLSGTSFSTPVTLNVFTAPRAGIESPLPFGNNLIGSISLNGTSNVVRLGQNFLTGTISAVNANLASGTATANSTVNAQTGFYNPLGDASQLSITVQTAFVGTLQVQVSGDFFNWESNTSATAITRTTTGAQSATITGPGTYEFNTGGAPYARVTASAYTSGAPTVLISAANAGTLFQMDSPLPAGTAVVGKFGIDQTTPGTTNAVAIYGGPVASSTGALTAATASATGTTNTTATIVAAVATAGNATITFKGTFSGTFFFEYSDDSGTTWYLTTAVRSDTLLSATNTGAITTQQAWNLSCPGVTHLRVRCGTFVSGSCTASIMPGGFLTDPAISATISGSLPAGAAVIGGISNLATAAALTDSIANPTTTIVAAAQVTWNGTTFERNRNNFNTTTGDTGAKTASFAGATQTNFNARGMLLSLVIGTVSGTTPTFTAQVQMSPDGGTTWVNLPGAVTASITATGTYTLYIYPGIAAAANVSVSSGLTRTWRLNYTIGGTTPSFALTNVLIGYMN